MATNESTGQTSNAQDYSAFVGTRAVSARHSFDTDTPVSYTHQTLPTIE